LSGLSMKNIGSCGCVVCEGLRALLREICRKRKNVSPMKKRNNLLSMVSFVCIFTVLVSCLLGAGTVHAGTDPSVIRLGGRDRIATSLRISDEGWADDGAPCAVIAGGYDFADAMAGVPLAAMLDAPVLLTKGDVPESELMTQLEKLGTKKAVLLGGEGRISADFAAALESRGIAVERISGRDRYATAAAVGRRMLELGAQPDRIFITSGASYPDALSVSPAAGVLGLPILYAAPDGSLSADTLEFLAQCGTPDAVIVGGSAAVPEAVSQSLAAAGVSVSERLSGPDRYKTSLAVNRRFDTVLSGERIALASGEDFPDALSGSALAARQAIPVMLISSRKNIDGAYDYLRGRNPSSVYIFGGEGAVTAYAADTFLGGGTITTAKPTTTTQPVTTKATTTTKPAQDTGKKVTSAGGSVNVRSGPGTGYDRLGAITPGKYLPVLDTVKGTDGKQWYKVTFEGKTGYVMGSLVTSGKVDNNNSSKGKKAYLTFDDGPSANTKKILDILDTYNVKATFFVIYRGGYESVYRDIVKRGHTIALHSYSHDYSEIYRSTSAYFRDLDRLSDYVYKLTGVRSKIMRFPGGGSNTVSRSYCRGVMSTLTREVQNRGYRYYDWNVDSGDADASRVAASTILSNVKRSCGSQKSAIVLMHDAPGKTTTVTALPDIIRYLRSKGYELLPITESTPQVHHAVNN